MDIKAILKATKEQVDEQIYREIDEYKKTIPAVGKMTEDALKRLAEFSVRGKGVRGAFTVLVAQMFDGDKAIALRVGSALEFVHSTLLMHDDIMDQDEIRRGAPTIWAQYDADGKQNKAVDPRLYGYSQAICIGDISFFLALRIVNTALAGNMNAQKIVKILLSELTMVGFGQMDDVYFGSHPSTIPNSQETNFIYEYKTARYTFSLPFIMGALIAKQDDAMVSSLEELGKEIGMLFQVRDDELGIISTEEELGKPIGSDIREDKKTPIRALFMERAPEPITSLFGKKDITQKNVATIQTAYSTYGIAEEITLLKKRYQNNAEKILQTMQITSEQKALFSGLTQFVMERTK